MVRLRRAAASHFGGLPAAFWWLWAGTLINRLGGFVLPFLAYYLTGPLHRSAAFAGLVAALYGLGAMTSGVVGGVLTDRIGRRATLIGSLLGNAVTIVLLGYARNPWTIAAVTLLVGLATNAFRPAVSALISDVVEPADRVRAYSLNFWAINIGFAVSMSAIGLVSAFGYRALFLGDAASTLLYAVLVIIKVRDTTPRGAIAQKQDEGLGIVARDRAFMGYVLTVFICACVYDQATVAQPMAMAHDGLSAADFGRVSAINGVLIFALQLPLVRWYKRFPESQVLAVACTTIGAGFAVPLFGHTLGIYALSVIVWTMGEIGYTPTSMSVVAAMAPVHLRGRYQGMSQMGWSGAMVVAPLAGGAAFGAYGGVPIWWSCLGLAVLCSLTQLRLRHAVSARIGQPISVEQPAPATA